MENIEKTTLVTVIVPTLCSANRASTLMRALRSILEGQEPSDVGVCALVVVNGARVDETTYESLLSMEKVRMLRLSESGVARAQRAGRDAVNTPYFCFLDDDDELIPQSLHWRVRAMESNPSIDVLVANGYRHENGKDVPCNVIPQSREDPHEKLLRSNWLASCSALYRTASVRPALWDGVSNYYEFTVIAHKLMLEYKLRFDERYAYRLHDTPGSATRSDSFRAAEIPALKKILELSLPRKIREGVEVKLGMAYHVEADRLLKNDLPRAWEYHKQSLFCPGGYRFWLYTRFFFSHRLLLRK